MKVRKRDGRIVEYDPSKINTAIWKAVKSVGGTDYSRTVILTNLVELLLEAENQVILDVEFIQD